MNVESINQLKINLKKCKDYNERDRLRSILSHFEHHKTAEEIAQFTYLHVNTIRKYINDYMNQDKTKNDPRGGSSSKLSEEQAQELKVHLQEKTYLKAKEIVAYVEKKYHISYTVSGMTFWMKENGFVYKKPVHIPGKLDPEKQDIFIQEYEKLKNSIPSKETVVFMDAVHPEYQSRPCYGWILRGELKHLSSTASQKRMHFIGGLELKSFNKKEHSIITLESEKVNAEATLSFFDALQKKYKDKKVIHVICDNATSFKCSKIRDYLAKNLKIKIKYLPTYSPNLNPIERLWKILREHIQYNQYCEKLIDFKIKVNRFFQETIPSIKDLIHSRINDNFQVFKPNLIKM